jgi:hypothetical protein
MPWLSAHTLHRGIAATLHRYNCFAPLHRCDATKTPSLWHHCIGETAAPLRSLRSLHSVRSLRPWHSLQRCAGDSS